MKRRETGPVIAASGALAQRRCSGSRNGAQTGSKAQGRGKQLRLPSVALLGLAICGSLLPAAAWATGHEPLRRSLFDLQRRVIIISPPVAPPVQVQIAPAWQMDPRRTEPPLGRQEAMRIQEGLRRQGLLIGPVDGVIGSGTRASIASWQVRVGAIPTGYLTHEQIRLLTGEGSRPTYGETPPAVVEGPDSRPGDLSDDFDRRPLTPVEVRRLQASLNRLGYNAGPEDGQAGRQTGRAVTAFLRDRGYDPFSTSPLQALDLALRADGSPGVLIAREEMRSEEPEVTAAPLERPESPEATDAPTASASLAPEGYWLGSYQCAQGKTGLVIAIGSDGGNASDGGQTAIAEFYPLPSNERAKRGSYRMEVTYREADRQITLDPDEWLDQPEGYSMVRFTGNFSPDLQRLEGDVEFSGCQDFSVSAVDRETAMRALEGEDVTLPGAALRDETPNDGDTAEIADSGQDDQRTAQAEEEDAAVPQETEVQGPLPVAGSVQLSGLWQGVAVCGRNDRLREVQLSLFDRQGVIRGFLRTDGGREQATATALDATRFELSIDDGEPVEGRLQQVDGMPPFLTVDLQDGCRKAFLLKPGEMPETGGSADNVEITNGQRQVTLNSYCKQAIDPWLDSSDAHRDEAFALTNRYGPYLDRFDPEMSRRATLFSDDTFTKFFGKPAAGFSAEGFAAWQEMLDACVILTEDEGGSGEFVRGYELFGHRSIAEARAPLRKGELPRPEALEETALHAHFLEHRATGGTPAEAVLANWREMLDEADPVRAAGAFVANRAEALSHVPPAEIDAALKEIFAEARKARQEKLAEQAGNSDFRAALDGRTPSVRTSDHLEGYTLLAPVFGHYVYAEDASLAACSEPLPMRVELSSLLALDQLENPGYLRSFFFYALFALQEACDWEFGGGGEVMQVRYFFDEEEVASADVSAVERDFSATNIELKRGATAHPEGHPDHLFDKAFVTMLGDAGGVSAPDLGVFETADLEALAERGDVQALFHRAIDQENRFNFALNRTVGYDTGLLEEASDRGSVAASYMLATRLGEQSGLIDRRTGRAGKDFAELGEAEQRAFRAWYAKAKAGGVFFTRRLDAIAEEWGIDVSEEMAFLGANGFDIAAADMPEAGIDTGEFGEGRALRALNDYFLRERCNRQFTFLNAADGAAAFGALLTDFEVSGGACIARYRMIGDVITFTFRIAAIDEMRCEPEGGTSNCAITYRLAMGWSNTGSRDNMAAFNVTYGNILRAAEKMPYTATADFRRQGGKWVIAGTPRFAEAGR